MFLTRSWDRSVKYDKKIGKCKMPHILLTNDDGYQAEGLRAVAQALADFATVSIVAPSREQSGTAQSLTLRQPIVCNRIAEREWAIDGTPADCVIVALHKLLPEKPDLLISGINHGANLGENVYYSGTVGAAREGALHHIPSMAVSLCAKRENAEFENSAFSLFAHSETAIDGMWCSAPSRAAPTVPE